MWSHLLIEHLPALLELWKCWPEPGLIILSFPKVQMAMWESCCACWFSMFSRITSRYRLTQRFLNRSSTRSSDWWKVWPGPGLDMISVPVNGSWGLYDNVKIMQRLFNVSQLWVFSPIDTVKVSRTSSTGCLHYPVVETFHKIFHWENLYSLWVNLIGSESSI